MIFDKLCRVVERHFSKEVATAGNANMRFMVEDARIFEIAGQECYSFDDHDNPDFIEQTFRLPFRTIAIEDELGCIILQDVEEHARGMRVDRWFITFRPVFSTIKRPGSVVHVENSDDFYDWWKSIYHCDYRDCYGLDAGIINRGWRRSVEGKLESVMTGRLGRKIIFNRDSILVDDSSPDSLTEEVAQKAFEGIEPAYEQIIRINSPTQFIVEETSVRKPGWKPPRDQITRSIDRPKYFTLPITEIRKKLGLPSRPPIPGEKRGPLKEPVERRGHFRYFKSPRYSEKTRETPKWINSYWVGPTEITVGKKHYKVLLDK